MSEANQHSSTASFYASPAEALKAPPEELLYLACLHEGTGVDAPDFLAVVDAADGRIVHETPMPNVGDELHHFGWNRCSSACHGPDRSHLIVPGMRSSRIHVLNVADDPRRPRIETVIEPQELVEKTGYTRPHTVHCMPGDNVVISMLGDADGNGAGGFAVLDARTFEVKGRWENGGPTAGPQLRLLVSAAQERARSRPSGASRTPTSPASTSMTSARAATGSGCTSGISPSGGSCRRSTSASRGWSRSSCACCTTPRPSRASCGATLVEQHRPLPPHERQLPGRAGDRGRQRGARGLAAARRRARADHRPGRLDGRPLPLLLQLAARRPAPIRHLRSHQPAADRPALARRAARQARRHRPRPERRTADDPAVLGRSTALRHQLAVLDAGTTSSIRGYARGCCA